MHHCRSASLLVLLQRQQPPPPGPGRAHANATSIYMDSMVLLLAARPAARRSALLLPGPATTGVQWYRTLCQRKMRKPAGSAAGAAGAPGPRTINMKESVGSRCVRSSVTSSSSPPRLLLLRAALLLRIIFSENGSDEGAHDVRHLGDEARRLSLRGWGGVRGNHTQRTSWWRAAGEGVREGKHWRGDAAGCAPPACPPERLRSAAASRSEPSGYTQTAHPRSPASQHQRKAGSATPLDGFLRGKGAGGCAARRRRINTALTAGVADGV